MSAIAPPLGAQPWRDTPQGRELLFARGRENGQAAIWKVNISSFEEVQLSQPPEDAVGDADASWSPDGESIAFVRLRSGRFELSVMPADGGAARLLLEKAWMPSWTSDGKRLVFSSDRSGHTNLWELTLASGALRQLTVGSGRDLGPALAADMGLLYGEFQHTLNLYRVDIQNAEEHEQLTSSSEAEEVNPRFPGTAGISLLTRTSAAIRRSSESKSRQNKGDS